jgi:hypothetical protein
LDSQNRTAGTEVFEKKFIQASNHSSELEDLKLADSKTGPVTFTPVVEGA